MDTAGSTGSLSWGIADMDIDGFVRGFCKYNDA